MKTNISKSVKGVSREYRKAMRLAGMTFPLSGAFHVKIRGGSVLAPQDILLHPDTEVVGGPAPVHRVPAPQRIGYFGEEADPCRPLCVPDDLPALPTMYRKRTSQYTRANGTTGTRSNYSEVRNPKPGETYFVRQPLANGKYKYVEKSFSKIVEAA